MSDYPQLLAHLSGDFLTQSSWMATQKHAHWIPAIVHAITYTACFLPITRDPGDLFVICFTHLLIDHYRLAAVWAKIVNFPTKKQQPVVPTWVIIANDQAMHLIINYLAITY